MEKKKGKVSDQNSNTTNKTNNVYYTQTALCRDTGSEGIYSSNSNIIRCMERDNSSTRHNINFNSNTILSFLYNIFCILGIICAWGTVDSFVDVISGKEMYISLMCYSILLFIALSFLIYYIYFIDRNYRPCDIF
ncbi:conserved Plasmodium protein, unknown function [Plasmodium sp. DRC-Itaito]|uniref:Uncharacterized protein n=1 Tax=Plasmodium gaboni TaxID=647221 RepID=A0ABY1UR95_9APIC|nr:conserved Plasmodium protein, unknown function [Plasmodium gaboni]SOV24045.1 conserved Plasmodium protein, unknown function [Plasmodium sp. DRC-Itaito]